MDCFIKKSVCTLNETGGIAAAQDYYPYGEVLRGYNQSLVNEKYKFNEKEQDVETNFDCFGARYYDGALGIWLQADPMAAKYPSWSSYNYCLNNPLRFTDPNGDTVKINDSEIQKQHDEAYNQKDGNGNYVNTAYRAQYDQLNASDVVYNVVSGNLGGINNGFLRLGDFGTKDGLAVTITLNMARGADILSDLSHEFVHGLQFEAGKINFGQDADGNWWTQNNSVDMELEAYSGQQIKPDWYTNDHNANWDEVRGLSPSTLQNHSLEPLTSNQREVRREKGRFSIIAEKK